MRGLKGKVAIVTGGAGRIGSAVVRRLVEEGVSVAVADMNLEGAGRIASAHGDRAAPFAFDAADPDSIGRMVEAAVDHFGRLDILHNNAAMVGNAEMGRDTTALDIPLDLWDAAMAINVRGYLVACRHAIPHIIAQGGGAIVNTASGAGFAGAASQIAYGTSKGAIITLTRYLATQHGRQGIRCNAVAPGLIPDQELRSQLGEKIALIERQCLTPRGGNADDIASVVAFLASDDAGFITGEVVACDGGMFAHQPHMADLLDHQAQH